MIQLQINGKQIQAPKGSTILETARANDIDIPTLCHADELEPYGACRLCMVEITRNNRTRLVAACLYTVEENLVVRTDTEKIKRIRKTLFELLWPSVYGLSKEYGVTKSRFTSEHTECAHCGLCVRYCKEVKKLNAAYFKGRGIDREVTIIPELANECVYCRECFKLCPAGWIVIHAGE
ncbi:2Fe-2S iron-sulfur cluster-binding protein [Thermodesulfobacteriota bacterium]